VRYHYDIFLLVSSLAHNLAFWLTHFWRLPAALREKKRVRMSVLAAGIPAVEREVKRWSPRSDKGGDWRPWVVTYLARGRRDDCDGAAVFGQWLLGLAGHPADIWSLKGPSSRHAVAVARDLSWWVTNDELLRLPATAKPAWKEHIMRAWEPRAHYTEMIRTG
jgi:hypothetical protein